MKTQGIMKIWGATKTQGATKKDGAHCAPPLASRKGSGPQPIFFFRFSSSFERKFWVFSQGWSLPISTARSLVM